MNRDEENIDWHGFKAAKKTLASLEKITAIQKASREAFNAEISVGYSKLQDFEHNIYFLVHRQDDVTVQSRTDLSAKLPGLLLYDEVIVFTEKSLSNASLIQTTLHLHTFPLRILLQCAVSS